MSDERDAFFKQRRRDPEMLAWYRLVRVFKKFLQQMDSVVTDFGLSRAQFDLLLQVAFEPGILQHVCAERMGVTRSNITQHVDQMEKRGWVMREKEGRVSRLFLTAEGRELIGDILPAHDAQVKAIFSPMTASEFQQFQSIMRKLDRGSG